MKARPRLKAFGLDISEYALMRCELEVIGLLHFGYCVKPVLGMTSCHLRSDPAPSAVWTPTKPRRRRSGCRGAALASAARAEPVMCPNQPVTRCGANERNTERVSSTAENVALPRTEAENSTLPE
jgi:hypothetical protein